MKKILLLCSLALMITLSLVGCSSKEKESTQDEKKYNYYTADELKEAIEGKKDITLVDIQVKDEYDKHHIKGTIPTYAYPAEKSEETAKLDKVLPKLEENKNPIIVVCPGGGGGAKRTIDYLESKGVKSDRLFILENGQKGWPYDELLEK
ncbi:rhodanese-like domain-containing protein [Paraclostridium ghonii]|uniref:rhodanese-like domain-containing protein n=1 Tax=Paraclostridium ghonii TaxID=29358 RepID=UPI00202CEA74|nr:rhodanese-like domain-containing protein [Paeniclostridium ghonii]MCM0168151.1 rhodanese-like domain-containing protein [Paeniclostridium ghonii]